MLQQVRNDGSRGIASMAISALDLALWDIKAELLGVSLVRGDVFPAQVACPSFPARIGRCVLNS
jgi:Mandelate racemase / muconate lactonizing enzyme, N-terminal domain